MGQGYPLTGPSPGANPPIYPSSLPLASGNLFSNIFPKSHGFFFFLGALHSAYFLGSRRDEHQPAQCSLSTHWIDKAVESLRFNIRNRVFQHQNESMCFEHQEPRKTVFFNIRTNRCVLNFRNHVVPDVQNTLIRSDVVPDVQNTSIRSDVEKHRS
jgi:hypothetical protein